MAAHAETIAPICAPIPTGNQATAVTQSPATDAVYLEADDGVISRQGTSELSGNVIIQRNQQSLNADKATYDRNTSQVQATGNVKLSGGQNDFLSDSVSYNLQKQEGEIRNAEYQMRGSHTNGRSELIKQKGPDQLELQKATYTTCPAPDPSWHIASGNITLNNATQQGTAKNVTLRIGDVPIFYFPWLSFSLNNERKSGFLSPRAGVSDSSGYELSIPYYFNLAPNYDALVTTEYLSDRGFKLNNQFRFMSKNSKGVIEYDFLPSDNDFDDKWRDYFNIDYELNLAKNRKITLQAEGVSDDDYFDDLGGSLSSSSTSALERELKYTREGTNWDFSISALDYQVLDDSSYQPYAKLPEIKFNYNSPHKYNKIDFSVDSEATYFESSDGPTGLRMDIGFNASKRFGNEAWYVKPSASYRVTQYSLEDNDADSNPSRALPTFTLDSGLVFDRTLANGMTQTLEPRFYYTYTPYDDQSDIPVFDSSLTDFATSSRLFQSNRFTGKDRIGDANQLTLGLTSRLQSKTTGRELVKASIGQVFYFDDRKVTLEDGDSAETDNNSEFALELGARMTDKISVSTTSFWDPADNQWSSNEFRMNYLDKEQRIFNVGYQRLQDELEELDLSFSYPVSQKWSFIGRADHDLYNNRSLELLAGIEYKDCCWGSRVVARRYLTSDNSSYDNALFFEVELKGLGSIGSSASSMLQEKIYGYE